MLARRVPLFALALLACSEEPKLEVPDVEVCLERRDGARYCIDVYEASREDASQTEPGMMDDGRARSLPGRIPWREIGWAGAREACERSGKRLCALDEWVDACDGVVGDGGNAYVYGDTIDASRCNVGGGDVVAVGTQESCKSITETYDQSGNLWEWSGTTMAAAAARGGGWRSSQTHGCDDTLPGANPAMGTAEIGFRCCRNN